MPIQEISGYVIVLSRMALTNEDKQWLLETFATKQELENMETKILTAFHQWASPLESRVRRHREGIHDLETELDSLTNRVKALEDRPHGKA